MRNSLVIQAVIQYFNNGVCPKQGVAQETKRCDVETYPTQTQVMKSLADLLPLGRKSDQT